MKAEKIFEIQKELLDIAARQRQLDNLVNGDTQTPESSEGLSFKDRFIRMGEEIENLLAEPYYIHRYDLYDHSVDLRTPNIPITFQAEGKEEQLLLSFAIFKSTRGLAGVKAMWTDPRGELPEHDELLTLKDIEDFDETGHNEITLKKQVDNIEWSFVQFRDAVLAMPLETAIEAGIALEAHQRLVEQAGRLYLAP